MEAVEKLRDFELKNNFAVDLDERTKLMGNHIFRSSKAEAIQADADRRKSRSQTNRDNPYK